MALGSWEFRNAWRTLIDVAPFAEGRSGETTLPFPQGGASDQRCTAIRADEKNQDQRNAQKGERYFFYFLSKRRAG